MPPGVIKINLWVNDSNGNIISAGVPGDLPLNVADNGSHWTTVTAHEGGGSWPTAIGVADINGDYWSEDGGSQETVLSYFPDKWAWRHNGGTPFHTY